MANLNQSFVGSFPFEIPAGKQGMMMFTVQSAANEQISLIKYPTKGDQQQRTNGTEYKSVSSKGVDLKSYTDGFVESGYYVCKIKANNNENVKILMDEWDTNLNNDKPSTWRMHTIAAAVEDWTDNDYNDVFLQIFYWKDQG